MTSSKSAVCLSKAKELLMSGINGDKSRFNRLRKQKIARRLRNHKMLKNMAAPASGSAPSAAKSKATTE
jgi:hypothetical protein